LLLQWLSARQLPGYDFPPRRAPIADLTPPPAAAPSQKRKLDLLSRLNQGLTQRFGEVSELDATIRNYELAFRMQTAVPELLDLSQESAATKELYRAE
jgi:hypothetical protein